MDISHICQKISTHSEVKTTKKTLVNTENQSINRYLSAAVLHVKPSCNNSNLNDRGIFLQIADSGSYRFLVKGTKIFRII